jgi:transcriptional regulator
MYLPTHFEENSTDALYRLIDAHPLGALILNTPSGLDANHVPFEVDRKSAGHERLLAHVARSNPLWQEARDGDAALVIFNAGDAYISPNWYPSKHEFHKQVPTWNYQVVHVHGKIKIRDDEKFVRGVVGRLTRVHEARAGDAKPWKMSDSSADYINEMITKIVGVEIEVTRLVGKRKLSQNKDERDRSTAAQALAQRNNHEMAEAMQRRAAD